MGTYLAYDPVRLIALRARAAATIDALRDVQSDDPAAAGAMVVARAAMANLEETWMPLIDRIIGSDALLSWLSALGGGAVPLGFRSPSLTPAQAAAAEELAELAREVIADGEPYDLEALQRALDAATDSPAVLVAAFTALGGTATAELFVRLGKGSNDEDQQIALAISLRSTLAIASRETGFPSAFAPALVDGFIAAFDDSRADPAAAMSFLFHDVTFGTEFLVAATRQVVEHEQAALQDEHGFPLWMRGSVGSVLRVIYEDDDDDGDDHAAPGWVRSEDPMYAILESMAGDGDAGRAVFTDDELARYLLGERRYDLDGLRAVSAAAATAAAGPDVVAGAPYELLLDAAEVASAYVNHVGSRPHLFDGVLHPDASTSAAKILGNHMAAVHNAVLSPLPVDPVAGDAIVLFDASRGPWYRGVGALFDAAALGAVTDLAVRRADGLATIRAALDVYQQQEGAATAGVLATRDDVPADFLDRAMVDAARLEAHFIQHAGHQAETIGRSKDDVMSFWIDVASFSIGKGLDRLPPRGGVPVIGELLGPAASLAKELLADHEATAERDAEAYAQAAADQLLYVWYRELYAAGVVEPDLPPAALDGDRLVPWSEFLELSSADQAVVHNRMREHWGASINGGALHDAIKVTQLPIYDDLD